MPVSTPASYVGRFAPSPTGPLHAGSLVAALASWLDARAHAGQWLLRVEDVDSPRCRPGAAEQILAQLAACGLEPDAPPVWQSQRAAAYAQALDALLQAGRAYPCACTRREIALALRSRGVQRMAGDEPVYPGTCAAGLGGRPARAVRLRTAGPPVLWHDRRLGPQQQAVDTAVGDFALRRADGLWAYQLAVVVDDAWQGVTDIVRGEDLADNTARQILLQRALGLPTPLYLHTPLVCGPDGRKLSKQHGAEPLVPGVPALCQALSALGLAQPGDASARDPQRLLEAALPRWRAQWGPAAG